MKLLKFQASWCGPCKMLAMTLNGMDIPFELVEIDIDETPMKAASYNVRSVPTLIITDDEGNEIRRVSGALRESQLKEFFG